MGRSDPPLPPRRAWPVLVGRALARRCPHCGGGPVFDGWLELRERCPDCGLRLERSEHGYFTGAWMLNIILAELAVVAVLVGGILAAWPDVRWDRITWVGGALVLVVPALTFPFTRTLWLALDLVFRPADAEDFRVEPAPRRPADRGGAAGS